MGPEIICSRKPEILGVFTLEILVSQSVVGEARDLNDKIHLCAALRFNHRNKIGRIQMLDGTDKIRDLEVKKMILHIAHHLRQFLQCLGGNLLPGVRVGHHIIDMALYRWIDLFRCCTVHIACAALGIVIVQNRFDLFAVGIGPSDSLIYRGCRLFLIPEMQAESSGVG